MANRSDKQPYCEFSGRNVRTSAPGRDCEIDRMGARQRGMTGGRWTSSSLGHFHFTAPLPVGFSGRNSVTRRGINIRRRCDNVKQRRTKFLSLRMTPGMFEVLKAEAADEGLSRSRFARNHLARPWAVLPWPMLFVALVYLQRLGQPSHNHGYTLYLSSYRRCSQGHALVAVGTHLASRQPRRGLAARPLHRLYHQ